MSQETNIGGSHASITLTEPLRRGGLSSGSGGSGKASESGSNRSGRAHRGKEPRDQRKRDDGAVRSVRHTPGWGGGAAKQDIPHPLSQQPRTGSPSQSVSLMKRGKASDASPSEPQASANELSHIPSQQHELDLPNVQSRPSGIPGTIQSKQHAKSANDSAIRDDPNSTTGRSGGLIQLPLGTETRTEEQTSTRSNKARPPHGKSSHPQGGGHKSHPRTGSGRRQDSLRHEHFDRGNESRMVSAEGSQPGGQQQLFDPKRHNAVSFSRSIGTVSSDARSSAAGSSITTAPTSATSATSYDSRDRRKKGDVTVRKDDSRKSSPDANGYVVELKRIYRDINTLEAKLKEEHSKAAQARAEESAQTASRTHALGRLPDGKFDHGYWLSLNEQSQKLIGLYEVFLDRALRPGLPASLGSLPQDYDIPLRLWKNGVHLFLEHLRLDLPDLSGRNGAPARSQGDVSFQAAILELMVDFIQFAYSFYTNVLEAEHLRPFKTVWLENLGDLARWRMGVADLHAASSTASKSIDESNLAKEGFDVARKDVGLPGPLPLDDTPRDEDHPDRASIGEAALDDWDFDEKEVWRTTAVDWYTQGLAEMPGLGKLHHSIALLHRTDELRCFYHLCKALTASQPYLAARETVATIALFGPEQQKRRTRPDAGYIDLLLHLQGMLFARVELDQFESVYDRLIGRLEARMQSTEEAPIDEPTWMMVASINIAALMQYGAEDALLALMSKGTQNEVAKGEGEGEGAELAVGNSTSKPAVSTQFPVLSSELLQSIEDDQPPVALQRAATLAFGILQHVMSQKGKPLTTAGPYVTMLFTFLFRLAKQAPTVPATIKPTPSCFISRFLPWRDFASYALPSTFVSSSAAYLQKISSVSPLPEDWCLRGLSWAGRKVFERDYWKPSKKRIAQAGSPSRNDTPTFGSEFEVLKQNIDGEQFEDNLPQGTSATGADYAPADVAQLRSGRVALTLIAIAQHMPGFDMVEKDGETTFEVRAPLSEAIEKWSRKEEESHGVSDLTQVQQPLDEADGDRQSATHVDLDTDTDGDEDDWGMSELIAEETDSVEVKELKARRLQLLNMLDAAQPRRPQRTEEIHSQKAKKPSGETRRELSPACKSVPGYTILLLDTNILLASDDYLRHLVECRKWTVVVPLAVITELDGLKKNKPPLGEEAAKVLSYLEKSIKPLGKWLKIQTSKGSYLNDLSFRSEDIDFAGSSDSGRSAGAGGERKTKATNSQQGSPQLSTRLLPPTSSTSPTIAQGEVVPLARSLDDIILRSFQWQSTHFIDRLSLLSSSHEEAALVRAEKIKSDTPKVVLVTMDRGMRLRVKAAGGVAAGRGEFVHLLRISGWKEEGR
ncbi:hypothetical protein BCV69DRAFT_146975 [Microstroma glucosiphilum]|uniref:PIN domain-containing protein n=1 Tax=Pseudomicrostroma glucosiphilum TaxID=1684307 RepID=A0A316UCF8_9BASI|nr:hypothetical protein BCV69DRAFT_146975 [Pseudomicrostroma glucosiphilum]PWN22544.1 hypothetical protein BCV69DRAFT_146975 [Pseudomicrostroma glucosiphilum]